jgi:hypothetical protein
LPIATAKFEGVPEMRKKIVMIGNTSDLPGVPVDLAAYYDFFTSPGGGSWCREEIDILWNPTRRSLFRRIGAIENADYDYVITIFSGHGFEEDDETVLTINGRRETITLNDLTNLSPRQLLIIDCCRSRMQLLPVDFVLEQTESTMLSMSRDPIRRAYEERIQDSIPQKVILFACDEGEKAYDSDEGGEYSQYLLNAAQMATRSRSPFVSVSEAHYKAVSMMLHDDPSMEQHPQILQPRCSTHRQLPLAVNPNVFL